MDQAVNITGLAASFRLIVEGACQVVRAYCREDWVIGPRFGLINNGLMRRLLRFERIVALLLAGVADPVRPARAARATAASAAGSERKRCERWPSRKGWLLAKLGWRIALYGYRLQLWLGDPENAALVRSSRKLRRVLRPIWNALTTDPLPDCLREPPREARSDATQAEDMREGDAREGDARGGCAQGRDAQGLATTRFGEEQCLPAKPSHDTFAQPIASGTTTSAQPLVDPTSDAAPHGQDEARCDEAGRDEAGRDEAGRDEAGPGSGGATQGEAQGHWGASPNEDAGLIHASTLGDASASRGGLSPKHEWWGCRPGPSGTPSPPAVPQRWPSAT